MTSSPARTIAWMAQKSASVPPLVTVISVSGSVRTPYRLASFAAISLRSDATPIIGGYWLRPALR